MFKLFARKPKKTPEEMEKERKEIIANTSNSLNLQITALQRKQDKFLQKVLAAREKGLREQEIQARNLLKQTMASKKRAEGMLMTLELAVESRDLAQLNMDFLSSIEALSDEIIASGKQTGKIDIARVGDKYTRAMYEANKQKQNIDDMMSLGEYAEVVNQGGENYPEFDKEVDRMIADAQSGAESSYRTRQNM